MPPMQMALAQEAMKRKIRNPKHPFVIKQSPFQIAPHCIVAVWPGETLKSALVQAKVVSDPIKSGIIGWHAELYYFYVKLTDLDDRVAFRDMVVDPDYDATAIDSPTDVPWHYFASGATRPGIDYVSKCMDRIVQCYFRDDDELPGDHVIGTGKYAAKITASNVMDSLRPSTEYEAATIDFDVDLDADATITASEVTKAQLMYQQLMQNGLIEKSYEDFLKSYGINPSEATEAHKPELLRYVRDWTTPTRIVDPADGSPVSAVQWALQERLDKARLFKEPGFIIGVSVFRPKVYFKNWSGTLTSYLQNGLTWLPGEVLNNVAFGIEKFATLTGPLEAATVANYSLDLRDLMLYGEQFTNVALATDDESNIVAVPLLDGSECKYITETDMQSLFSGAAYDLHMDGIFAPSIASYLGDDLTPSA